MIYLKLHGETVLAIASRTETPTASAYDRHVWSSIPYPRVPAGTTITFTTE